MEIEKQLHLVLKEDEYLAVKKVIGSINDTDYQIKFKLNSQEIEFINNLWNSIPDKNEED